MPTILTHMAVPLAVAIGAGSRIISRRLLVAGAIGAMLPDLDVIGFRFGIEYASDFGHRGFTHSLMFAAFLRWRAPRPGDTSTRAQIGFSGFCSCRSPHTGYSTALPMADAALPCCGRFRPSGSLRRFNRSMSRRLACHASCLAVVSMCWHRRWFGCGCPVFCWR
jgi:hypothetical protein